MNTLVLFSFIYDTTDDCLKPYAQVIAHPNSLSYQGLVPLYFNVPFRAHFPFLKVSQ